MCIWVMPDRMANFGLTVKDLQDALKDQNRESAAGELGKQPISGQDITIPITTQGRLSTVNEFEEIVVRANSRRFYRTFEGRCPGLSRLLPIPPRVV